jgi:threonylcarbamoyladenosine tRNA methylthiotransferase MtaB
MEMKRLAEPLLKKLELSNLAELPRSMQTQTPRSYVLKTLGCKANLYDSQVIEEALQMRGWHPSSASVAAVEDAPVQLCIINSCTVTNEADKQTRKLAKKMAKDNPHAAVLVTGCGAEVDPEGLAKTPGVHFVVGNQNKPELLDLVFEQIEQTEQDNKQQKTSHILDPEKSLSSNSSTPLKPGKILGTTKTYEQILSKHPLDREWPAASDSFRVPLSLTKGMSKKTRTFLKIQEGCNSFCTYCIIPYGRGPSRSLRPRELIEQIRALVSEGVREVVITGTNVGDYGTDWSGKPELAELFDQILNHTPLERLRVSSLDPTEITSDILALMRTHPRFCPHFHVSLQSPHSRILRLMKRKYGYEEVKHCLEEISKIPSPLGGAYVGMDLITGFPGETDDEFEVGYKALASLPWHRLHVFPYSERAGTPATRLPNSVTPSVRVDRARKLTQLSMHRLEDQYRAVLKQCKDSGQTLSGVLMENQGNSPWMTGLTSNYFRVMIPGSHSSAIKNEYIGVRPTDIMVDTQAHDVSFIGEPVQSDSKNKIG